MSCSRKRRSSVRAIARIHGTASAASTASIWVTCSLRCSTCNEPIRVPAGERTRPQPQTIRRQTKIGSRWHGRRLRKWRIRRFRRSKIVDLGLIRFVRGACRRACEVGLSPTYMGCPATEVIRHCVEQALRDAQIGDCVVTSVLSPAWSSDWITAEGRHKLLRVGHRSARALLIEHAGSSARRSAAGVSALPVHAIPNASVSLVQHPAKHCIAAAPVSNPSNTSSASDHCRCLAFMR